QRGKPAADGEGESEQQVDIDADRLRHAPVVDRGADLCANPGSLEAVPERGNERGADRNQKYAVGRKAAAANVDLTGEVTGNADRLRLGAVKIRVGRNRHEGEPDGREHLIEFAGAVDPGIE